MENITRDTITELLKAEVTAPVVTIYCPMHTSASPPHLTEEQIRLKNLIHDAAGKLKENYNNEAGRALEKALCDHLDRLQTDQEFWESHTEGLLLCANIESIKMLHLPADTEEYVGVDNQYHLAPVYGIVNDGQEYYVLVVAQHQPALFKGDMYSLHATNIELPETLESGLNLDEVNQKSEHARSAGGSSLNTSGFQGRGGARDPSEEDRARFFRMIDKIVCDTTDRTIPLVLAGIDSEIAEYRNISNYPKILIGAIQGSYSGVKPHDLFEPVKNIIRSEIVDKLHTEAIDEFENLMGSAPDKASNNLDTVAAAAEQGRIDKLLLSMSRFTTDTVGDNLQPVPRITFPDKEMNFQIQSIANKVWRARGSIININLEQMPERKPLSAIFRY